MATPSDAPGEAAPAEKVFVYRWPPFPPTPEGKTIVPFKDFKPKGIHVADSDNEDEFDAEGIKTVKLPGIKHVLDPVEKAAYERAKRVKRRRKKHEVQGAGFAPMQTVGGDDFTKFWYEEWEESQYRERVTPLPPGTCREDRFEQIITDFFTDRRFPRIVQSIHDNFRMYVGLMLHPNAGGQPGSKRAPQEEPQEDEDERMSANSFEDAEDVPGLVPVKDSKDDDHDNGQTRTMLKEDKINRFLDDPERGTKVFLSSYANERGITWDPEKRKAAPILIAYVLEFIIRHDTLKDYNPAFQKALKIAERAKFEAIGTAKIADVGMDKFAQACGGFFGDWKTPKEVPSIEEIQVPEPVVEEKDEPPKPEEDTGWGDFGGADWNAWTAPQSTWEVPLDIAKLTDFYPADKLPSQFKIIRVERGVRRIKNTEPPNPTAASEWRKPLGVLVMEPWPNPKVKETTYTPPPVMEMEDVVGVVKTIPPHDMTSSTIRVYFQPEVVEGVKDYVGMGITGYWVQVGLKEGADDEPSAPKKSKSKSKAQDSPTNFWYLQSQYQVIHSFYED